MPDVLLHRFEHDGRRFVIDPETCFCFECDAISWDVLEFYPKSTAQYILHRLQDQHPRKELEEVIGELEWLRSCKSILPALKQEEMAKAFEIERGLKQLTVCIPNGASAAETPKRWFAGTAPAKPEWFPGWMPKMAPLLMARSGAQKELTLEFRFGENPFAPGVFGGICADALQMAQMAGKNLTVSLHMLIRSKKNPEALADHVISAAIELRHPVDPDATLREWAAALGDLNALARILRAGKPGVSGRVVLTPRDAAFTPAVKALHEIGFPVIEIDLDSAFAARSAEEPSALFQGLQETAVYYAQCLLKQQYFRLDPIAPLFLRIYHGTPQPRSDGTGLYEWAVDEKGDVYPSIHLMGRETLNAGSVASGTINEELLTRFDDVGALTTAPCRRCWARNLCGGGACAVHQALSGDWRQPFEPWCQAQRLWMERAVAAFNLLSAQGVNFTRMYAHLGQTVKPSLFQLARAAFRMSIGLRPIEESDAEWLTRWENWNEAAYFTFNESGMLMATKYDREMDSLHPRGFEQEFILIHKNGAPFGLMKIRPERLPETAMAWLYMKSDTDYASETVRKSFRNILKELSGQQQLTRLFVPVGPFEDPLADFLQAIGFEPVGALREAFYLHGQYHPIRCFRTVLTHS